MKRKFWQQSYLFLLFVIPGSCSILNNQHEKLFKVEDTYYQSWMVNEQEKGINIFIEVSDVKNGVLFDSIIYRGMQIPATIESNENNVVIKGTFLSTSARIEANHSPTDKPDQFSYSYKGKHHFYKLKDIRRENMKYY